MKKLFLRLLFLLVLLPIVANITSFSEVYFLGEYEYSRNTKYLFSLILIILYLLDYKTIKDIGVLTIFGIIILTGFDYFDGTIAMLLSVIYCEVYLNKKV